MSDELGPIEVPKRQGVSVPVQQPKNPEPTDFDIKAFALDKAVQTHGFSLGGDTPPDPQKVTEAAREYESFLRDI